MLAGPHTPSGCSISLLFPASRGHWHFLAHGPFLQLQSSRVEFKSHSLFLLSYHFSLLRGQGRNSVGATEQKSLRISPKHVFPEHLTVWGRWRRRENQVPVVSPSFLISSHPSQALCLYIYDHCVSWKIKFSLILNGKKGRTLFTLLLKRSFLVLSCCCIWSRVLNSQTQGWKLMAGAAVRSFMLKGNFKGLPSVSRLLFSK